MNSNYPSAAGKRFQILQASVLIVATVWFAGCRTAGYRKHDAAAWNSQAAAGEIQAEIREIEAVTGALEELVNQPATDAKPQFLRFSDAIDRLAVSTRRAGKGVDRLAYRRTGYFEVWDKEIAAIKDEEIRKSSEARKAEVARQFDSAIKEFDQAQDSLHPLIDYLIDIRTALSADLIRQGLTAAQPSAASAREKAGKVQSALTQSAAELDALSARMASYRVHDVK